MNKTSLSFLAEYVQQPSEFEDPDKAKKAFKDQKHFTISLFDAMREGCLVLDKDLKVKAVNIAFQELFQVNGEDTVGKLIFDLGNGQWNIQEFRKLLEEMLPERKEINNYKVVHEFKTLGRRVMILNARMINHLELVLLAIEDITVRDTTLAELNQARDDLETKVKERTHQVHSLARRLSRSEQQERHRISGLLHDDLQQVLVALQMDLKTLYKKAEKDSTVDNLEDHLQRILGLTDKAIKTTRDLTGDLNPSVLKSEKLSDILEWLKDRFENLYDFKTILNINTEFQIIQESLRVDLLQFIRECIFNVVKHADVNFAEITVNKSEEDHLVICVIDQGKGFSIGQEKLSYGLSNIKDRIFLHDGKLDIQSAPGEGTKMTIRIPIDEGSIQTI